MTSFGSFGESLQSNVLSGTTDGKELPEPPIIIALKSSGTDEITIVWEEPKVTTKIVSYEIERKITDKEGFSMIASVPIGTTDFTDTKLTQSTIYTYRILSTNDAGTGKPSNEMSSVSSVDIAVVDSIGKILEQNPTNSFTKGDSEIIAQTIELFNVDTQTMDAIINDIDVNKLNAYQIILKMIDGSYDNTQEIKNAGIFYGTVYLESNDISIFINNVAGKVLSAVNGEIN